MVASKLGLGFRVLGGQLPARQTVSQPACQWAHGGSKRAATN